MKAKLLKPVAALLMLAFIGSPAQAQFLKNLKKTVERRVEQTVTDKMAKQAAAEAGKTKDQIMEGQLGGNSPFPIGMEQVSLEEVPDSYDFQWAYELNIETEGQPEGVTMTYYLKEGASYWGARLDQGVSLFMVFDVGSMLTVMFMDNEGEKFMTATKISEQLLEGEQYEAYEGYELREIAGKQILGYDCKGYEMEDDQYKFTVYTTFETDVSLSDMYKKSEHFPRNFDMAWIREGDRTGMLMELNMQDKTGKNDTARMVCTRLEKEPYSVSKADYKGLGGM